MNATPLYVSMPANHADIQGYEIGRIALKMKATPQGELIARVLGSYDATTPSGHPLYVHDEAVIQGPRRCSKTSSIQAVLLGRCLNQEGYRVVSTAQSGILARARFKDVMTLVDHQQLARCYWAAGQESMSFANGSSWVLKPPKPGSFRSEGADAVWLDELQEIPPELGAELDQAIGPLGDTRESSQVIYSGTPGLERAGLLWDALQRGRKGEIGVVDYAAADEADTDDEAVWWATHPGLGTLTTIQRLRKMRGKLGKSGFEREYLGRWPSASQLRLYAPDLWAAGLRKKPVRPARFALGFDTALDATSAAVVAAWRTPEGQPWVEVLAAREGVRWLPKFVLDLHRKYRANLLGVAFDAVGQNLGSAEIFDRARPKPKMAPLNTRRMVAACSIMHGEITSKALLHATQADLDSAIEVAARRKLHEGGWIYSRTDSAAIPLLAATSALSAYDAAPVKQETSITVAI